jgi:hypothetical protein
VWEEKVAQLRQKGERNFGEKRERRPAMALVGGERMGEKRKKEEEDKVSVGPTQRRAWYINRGPGHPSMSLLDLGVRILSGLATQRMVNCQLNALPAASSLARAPADEQIARS